MNKSYLVFFGFLLLFSSSKADEQPMYEFKNGELLIHSNKTNSKIKSKPNKFGKINSENIGKYKIPAGSLVETKVVSEVVVDGNIPRVILVVTQDFVIKSEILIPKGSLFTGIVDLEPNQRIDMDISSLETPNGDKHYIDASGRDWNGKSHLQAKFVSEKGRGTKVFSRTAGSVVRGIFQRNTSDTVGGDVLNEGGQHTVSQTEEAIEDKTKSKSYSKVEKDTKVKVLFEKGL